MAMKPKARVGIGYDAHKLVDSRPLVLGGVRIEHERGLDGHSDADVLIHALMDALLGAAGMGDIGQHFPDTDEKYRDADSLELMKAVLSMIGNKGWKVGNADVTLLAENPQIAPHIVDMTTNLEAAGMPEGSVNIKATRGEGMGFIGREEGIAAIAVAMIEKRDPLLDR
jgi:2-C-methyl-D-erythritol 2,4-cyclodiphosphate synthase